MYQFIKEQDPLELRQLLESVRRFAQGTLRREKCEFDRKHFSKMGALGLTALSLEEGNKSFGALGRAGVCFELSREELGPAIYLGVHLMVLRLLSEWDHQSHHTKLINDLASGEKLAAYCLTEPQAGSDASALRLKAEKKSDGYVLNGEKVYITSGGFADTYLVFARTGEEKKNGISAFVVANNTPGLSFGKPERKMGCEGSPISSVSFENCFVKDSALLGKIGDGYRIALSGLNGGRINIAACACGLASRSLEIGCAHLKDRKQFGESLATFQGLQFLVADMAMKLQASILLTRDAAQKLDTKSKDNTPAALAKCFATDRAMEITTDSVQLLGGAGYLMEYQVERFMRDAKMLQIVEGTNQIQRVIIARSLLGEAMERS